VSETSKTSGNSGNSSPAIEAVDVRKAYDRGKVPALDGVTLTVPTGEYVALTGPSGCGKSTLLHLLAALDRPDSGSLRVHGVDLAAVRDLNRYRREQVGLVFQLHNLLPHLSAAENVEIAMLGTGRDRRQQRERARELLAAVGLSGFEHRRPPELSGGERQRVAIARALANHPPILLADEPTGSLDTRSVETVLALFHQLHATEHVTIVLVTHDPTVAAAANQTIHLRDGHLVPTENTPATPTRTRTV
jgi:ABC-type lipoprotein export system ATPase subunit